MPPDDPMLSVPICLFFRKRTKLANPHAAPNCAGFPTKRHRDSLRS